MANEGDNKDTFTMQSAICRVVQDVPDALWELIFMHLSNAEQQRLSTLSKAHRVMYVTRRRQQMAEAHRRLPIHQAMAVLNPSPDVVPADTIDFYDGLMAEHTEQKAAVVSRRVQRMEREHNLRWPRRHPKPPSDLLLRARYEEREAWTAATDAWNIALSSAARHMNATRTAATDAAACAPAGQVYMERSTLANAVAEIHKKYHNAATARHEGAKKKLGGMIARDKDALAAGAEAAMGRPASTLVARASRRNDFMHLVLLSDNSLWCMKINVARWQRLLGGDNVLHISCGQRHAAAVLTNGKAVVYKGEHNSERHTDLESARCPEQSNHIVHVCCRKDSTFFLTAEGSIWYMLDSHKFIGDGATDPDRRFRRFNMGGLREPKFTLLSAAELGGILAADSDGHLYTGDTVNNQLTLRITPDPPAPVRDVFVTNVPTPMLQLALLVDGRVWSVPGQRIVPVPKEKIFRLSRGSPWWDDDRVMMSN